jgi:putative ABC transport system permease protein
MKFWPLLFANLKRKKTRTVLTIGSFAVTLFLYGLLVTIQGAFNQGIDVAGTDRLLTLNRVSLTQPLPLSYRERILQVEGVKSVTFATWFGGVYQDEKNFFPQYCIEPDSWLKMYPEYVVPREQWAAFLADREGCIVGRGTFERFRWKIGDRIPLRAPIWGGVWEFNIRGVYDGTRKEDDVSSMWLRWDYWNERTPFGKGTVGWYILKVDNADHSPRIVKAIDEKFANSPWETKTETEKAFATGFVKQVGNIQLLILATGAVVFFTLLLVTGNTMALAVRERTGEFAVLKTVGFSDRSVLLLILAESLILALLGGCLGLALVKLFTLSGDPTHGMLPFFYLPMAKIALGLLITVIVGLVAGIVPAVLTMRLKIVDALRRV